MPDRLMQQNAAVARRQDDWHRASGRFDRILLEDCLPCGVPRQILGRNRLHALEPHTPATARPRRPPALAPLGKRGHVEPDEGMDIARDPTVTARYKDDLHFVRDARVNPGDARVDASVADE